MYLEVSLSMLSDMPFVTDGSGNGVDIIVEIGGSDMGTDEFLKHHQSSCDRKLVNNIPRTTFYCFVRARSFSAADLLRHRLWGCRVAIRVTLYRVSQVENV